MVRIDWNTVQDYYYVRRKNRVPNEYYRGKFLLIKSYFSDKPITYDTIGGFFTWLDTYFEKKNGYRMSNSTRNKYLSILKVIARLTGTNIDDVKSDNEEFDRLETEKLTAQEFQALSTTTIPYLRDEEYRNFVEVLFLKILVITAQRPGNVISATVGGKPRAKERWDTKKKEAIMGMVQREGKVYLKHVEGTGKWAILEQVQSKIDPRVRVITDEWGSYKQLKKNGYNHNVINHKRQYVMGDIHTQNIENVWSHLKRGIFGVYRHVSKKYLQAYADEFSFRYNNRKSSGKMFELLLQEIVQVRMISVKQLV